MILFTPSPFDRCGEPVESVTLSAQPDAVRDQARWMSAALGQPKSGKRRQDDAAGHSRPRIVMQITVGLTRINGALPGAPSGSAPGRRLEVGESFAHVVHYRPHAGPFSNIFG